MLNISERNGFFLSVPKPVHIGAGKHLDVQNIITKKVARNK